MSEIFIMFMRELIARVRRRSFMTGTLRGPILTAVLFGLQFMGAGTQHTLIVLNEAAPEIGAAFTEVLTAAPRSERDNSYRAELRSGAWDEQRAELDAAVLANR